MLCKQALAEDQWLRRTGLRLEVAHGLLNNMYTKEPAARARGASLQEQIIAEAVRQQALCNEF